MRSKRYTIDLPRHMAECDANYLRIGKLFPRLDEHDHRSFALGDTAGPRVVLEVVERSPYTTLLQITQRDGPAWDGEPTMKVRLYHDARSAEVVEMHNERRFEAVYEYPNQRMRHRDEKVQVNRFLGEYLAHCLTHGVSVSEPALAPR